MKQFFIFDILIIILFSSVFAQNGNEFTLVGSVKGIDTGKIYLRYYYNNKVIKDSSEIISGKFSFKGLINEPSKAELSDDKTFFTDSYKNYVPPFYIEPSEMSISLLKGDFSNAILYGSKTEDDYKLFYNELNPVLNNISRLQKILNTEKNSELKDSLVTYNNKSKEISFNFIRNHPNSSIAINAVQQLLIYKEIGPDSCLFLLNSLTDQIKDYFTSLRMKEWLISNSTSQVGRLTKDF